MYSALKSGPLVIATHNEGKAREFRELLRPHNLVLKTAGELGLADPEETGDSFEDNAALKARAATAASGLPALGDDSGLVVDALKGDPGIYSARWAGPDRDFDRAMRLVEERLQQAGATEPDQRRASFVCVLALCLPEGPTDAFQGRVDGQIVWPPRGDEGFGYDSIFLPDGQRQTFGEMPAPDKHGWAQPGGGLSHRARAFALFARHCL